MIREDRDWRFWADLIAHPAIAPLVTFGQDIDIATVIGNPWCVPLRSDRGGFLFFRLDGVGRVYELHTAFRPEAWGTREIPLAAAEAFETIFAKGAQLVITYEVAGNRRSQPPRSFRFAPCGDFAPAANMPEPLRTWSLSKSDWEASPARLRMSA